MSQTPAQISRRRVVVTGLGAVTPVGNTAVATWDALQAGRSGIGPLTRYDTTGCPVTIGGEVRNFDPAAPLPKPLYPRGAAGEPLTHAVSPKEVKRLGRFSHLGLVAAVEAYADSGLDGVRATISPERMGVNVGVAMGGLPEVVATQELWKTSGYRKISPFFIIQAAPNILAGQLAIALNLKGPNMSVASACATSGHALGESLRAIQRGDADVMIAGGAEAVITPIVIGAFAQMKALSTRNDAPEKASRPYDADRDGFVLGEGAVVFVLEELEHAQKRGARIYAELCGYGATADAHHISMLAPEAEGSQRSMRGALADAGVAPAQVGFVAAHATSTPGGDVEEAGAIASVFAEAKGSLHVSGVKSMTGHLLGAAGAMGAFSAVQAIKQGVISPTINLDHIEPACASLGLDFTANVAVKKHVDYALANSFGFGGTNASLVFGRI
ncbi:MAG: 3-oxoacyl-(acyl-carrier-protein) synthase 2 [Verrucomicrobia bacterium ADurb.Bin122]|mgnify:FL=1|jgi:3-oxoacyl-[acyl-carrier-protein] synthase II|nr:MAG: 3-oxoacyl-(acyl-carrier-protein) synthase 2 [Verrucomicrobia bacterium ADurb.Bin122]HOY54304.1 beta-ketoacyl-ACP synthase II [Opitutaceae bacterium]HPG18703.1 beta-ketoacyl-ACP synthase II [Opitutaceae bacterium]HQL20850.1 beta-ketoacyl-ACP synthase II [Opitutaceae bacterium]